MADKNDTAREAKQAVRTAATEITRAIEAGDDEGTQIASADAEEAMRKEATSPKAVKEAIEAGKKDPIQKWGDPKLSDEDAAAGAVRRSAFGGV